MDPFPARSQAGQMAAAPASRVAPPKADALGPPSDPLPFAARAPCPCRRKDNLAARTKTKLDNRKAKREKKLLRAGFEGRKSGFISPGGGGGGK
jgi:hypothetical protein